MNEFKPRKQITFFRSYYEIGGELTSDKARLEWYDTIMKIQFLEVHIDDIEIKNKELKILFISIKHSLQTSIEGYCSKMKIKYDSLFYDTKQPLPNPLVTPSGQVQGQEEEQEKEEDGLDTTLRFVTLSPIFSSKADTKTHKPRQVTEEVEKKFSDKLRDQEAVDIVNRFISYRDEMYTSSKDAKYRLKTYRAVEGFMSEISSVADIESAFRLMENKEWATYDRTWVKGNINES